LTTTTKTKEETVVKEAIWKAELNLDEGVKALAIRQKHIKIADNSNLSWETIKHCMADPLADALEDKKDITRSEKEAQIDQESPGQKRLWTRWRWKRKAWQTERYEPYGDYGRRERYAPPAASAPSPIPQRNYNRP